MPALNRPHDRPILPDLPFGPADPNAKLFSPFHIKGSLRSAVATHDFLKRIKQRSRLWLWAPQCVPQWAPEGVHLNDANGFIEDVICKMLDGSQASLLQKVSANV